MYETIEDIPEEVRKGLPDDGVQLYLDAFQDSWERYEPERGGDMGQEGVAHRDAMNAIFEEYVKDKNKNWHHRDEVTEEDLQFESEDDDKNIIEQIGDALEPEDYS